MYGSYLVIVVLLVLAPGPDTMVFLRNALAGGARRGLHALSGIFAANVVQGSAAVFGLGALIAGSQSLFTVLRWLGVGYLIFLGVQALLAARRGDYAGLEAVAHRPGAGARAFREGFLSNVTNPKVLVMYLSVLPQFLQPGVTTAVDALLLAYSVAVVGGLYLLALALLVHRVRGWLARRRVRRSLDIVTGTALLGFGVALASH
jgi:threonine/homoserine/homoserine lactone efflux protein